MLNILITVSVFAITAYWWTVGVYAGRILKGAKPRPRRRGDRITRREFIVRFC